MLTRLKGSIKKKPYQIILWRIILQKAWQEFCSSVVSSDMVYMTWTPSRGIMLIQSEGARALSDFEAKWILSAAFKRQKIVN